MADMRAIIFPPLLLAAFMSMSTQASALGDARRDTAIARLMLGKMLQLIPSRKDRVCVIAMDPTNTKSQEVGGLGDLDSRIATGDKRCLQHGPKDMTEIILGTLNADDLEMAKLNHKESMASYDLMLSYVRRDFSLYTASIGECGGDNRVFVFKRSGDASSLVDALSLGRVDCHTIIK